MKLFIQMGSEKSNDFGNVPSVFDYAKTDEDQRDPAIPVSDSFCSAVRWQDRPAYRPIALRYCAAALFATMKDPQFLAEATKAGLDIDPVSPEDVMALLKQFSRSRPRCSRRRRSPWGVKGRNSMLATGAQKLERMRDGRASISARNASTT